MTQGELEKIPNEVVKAMSDLEIRIMEDMVRRIRVNGFSTASADWQFTRLEQLGMSEQQIKTWVQETLNATDEEIERIYSDEAYQEYMGHSRAYKVYGRERIPFDDNAELQQLIEAVKRQTGDEMTRITGSMGFVTKGLRGNLISIPLTEFYQRTLDNAMYDIHSGAFDYNSVLGRVINDMTNSGLRWIDYESGHHNRVPVAARRAVMTGFRQVQEKINEQVARDLGTDSYEVTVHIGARPTHQVWEGQVWTMDELHSVCGLGTVTGLHGANCYHDYNAFIPGVSVRTYTDDELKQIHEQENTPKTYNGKEYTTYEALQRQRQLETRARKYREDVHLLQKGDGSEDDILAKKARYQGTLQEYRRFSDKMNLPMQKERIYQDGLGKIKAPRDLTPIAAAKPQAQVVQVVASPKYTPFKTIDEAQSYAERFVSSYKSKYSGNLSYKSLNIDAANDLNEVLTQVFEDYDVEPFRNITPMNMRENRFKNTTSDAAYQWFNGGDLFYNPKYYKTKKALQAHIDEGNKLLQDVLPNIDAYVASGKARASQLEYLEALKATKRQCVAQTRDYTKATFAHECGHMLDDKVFRTMLKDEGIDVREFYGQSMGKYAKHISGYAVSDSREYIAESFAAYYCGETDILDPDIVSMFERAKKWKKK